MMRQIILCILGMLLYSSFGLAQTNLGREYATVYGDGFAGKRMASGEAYNPQQFTIAHRTLPFGTKLRLSHPTTNASVEVVVNDRMLDIESQNVRVSSIVAQQLGIVSGQAILIDLLQPPPPQIAQAVPEVNYQATTQTTFQNQIPEHQPVVQQPVYQQPVVQQPVYQQPIVQQPVAQQPVLTGSSGYRVGTPNTANTNQSQPVANAVSSGVLESGNASFYGDNFHGRPTASGEHYNENALTAAHRTLPFGTKIRVVHQNKGTSVDVRVNDRGPYKSNRVIDVSRRAAEQLNIVSEGIAPVALYLVAGPTGEKSIEAVNRQRVGEITGNYTIQVASYFDQRFADEKLKGFPNGWIETVEGPGKTVFRINYGRFESKHEADQALPQLAQYGLNGFVKAIRR